MADSFSRSNALDHVVVVLFENRSFDNVLGHLYGPGDGKTFDGVIGKELSNPIPEWAEHGAERKVVPYTVATDMDSPNPDSGEEWFHTNTQLYNILDEHNRFKLSEGVTAPWNAPPPGTTPTMDGFVTDYISTFTAEIDRQPTYEEYAHIMTGYTPEQLPVLNGIARDFGVFDHWFSEVPSQTFMNRSFWTSATSSGLVVNNRVRKWFTKNDGETIFERLEQHGKTWKVYVKEPMPLSFTGVMHYSRLKDRLATHFVPFAEFERDAADGTLPDFSFIEPNFIAGHGDYHPAFGRALGPDVEVGLDPPSSMLVGEAFLERVFNAYRSAASESGANVWNTTLFIGWDEPGGTYDHVPPVRPRRPTRRTGRRVRLHVRPFRLPRARHRRLALGRARLGVQRRIPPHLADRDAAEDVGSRRGVHPTRRRGAHLRARVQPRHAACSRDLGDHHRPARPRLAHGRGGRRQGPQFARQGHRARDHRPCQGQGHQAPASTRRRPRDALAAAHARRPQGRRLALLPPARSGRQRPLSASRPRGDRRSRPTGDGFRARRRRMLARRRLYPARVMLARETMRS